MRGTDLVVSDDHGGLVKAVRQHFQGATWQRCQAHFLRNILDAAPKALKADLKDEVKAILHANNMDAARLLLEQTLEKYENTAVKAMEKLENGFEGALAVAALPEKYRRRLRTTNCVERLNTEVRRQKRVIRIFPNRESVNRLIGAVLMELDEKWSGQKTYLDLREYWHWREKQ